MNAKSACALLMAIISLFFFSLVVTGPGVAAFPATTPPFTIAGAAMWKGRTFEVILQGLIILAGVISILLLLHADRSKELSP